MKGGIAAMIKAVETLIKLGIDLKGDITIQSVVNEEHSGNGTLYCVAEGYEADAVLITEPSGSETVITQNGGGVYWEVIIKGRETHAGERWQGKIQYGISAIEKAPVIINSLLEMEKKLK